MAACRTIGLSFVLSVAAAAASSQEIPSPYSEYYGTVERIIDGDTMVVRVDLWPGLEAIYAVRARNIDAPELRGANCSEELAWAEEAKAQAERLYAPGTTVRIENVELDSFGRAVAEIRRWRSDRWMYFGDEMTERGMAEAWQEGWEDIDWCLLAANR
jgi:endonuclease YncB( thermonuclease family)